MGVKHVAGAIIITGDAIQYYRLCVLVNAIKLEQLGLRRRGKSATQIVKQEFGFKGNRERVLKQLQEHIAKHYQ